MRRPYHFLLTPQGSAGDVFPFIALGRELRRRGFDVTVLTPEPFEAAVLHADLVFVPSLSLAEFDEVARARDIWNPRRGLAVILAAVSARLEEGYERLVRLYEPGRTVLVGHSLSVTTRLFEEAHDAPAATVHLAPAAFRSIIDPPALAPGRTMRGWPPVLQRALWWAVDKALADRHIDPALNRLRRRIGLPPVTRIFHEWLHSPQLTIGLFPDWFAPRQPDWPDAVRLTGFPLYDDGTRRQPDAHMGRFLDDGPPPILFTPGSANVQAGPFFAAAALACERLDSRGLFVASDPDNVPRNLPKTIHHTTFAPFASIFPRCAAVVHHGGIGTSAQGLAAGVPQLVMPMGYDQPDNATRLMRLGVAAALPPHRFAGHRVADALTRLLDDPTVAEACHRCRDRLASENGVRAAGDLLEDLANARVGASASPR